jgi:putative flippase GtrA
VFRSEPLQAKGMNLRGLPHSLERTQLLKLVRFGAIGLSSSLLYGLMASALIYAHVRLVLAHCIAYALALPFSYFAQRGLTFRSNRSHMSSFPRFLLTNAASFLLSTGIIAMSAALQVPATASIAAVIIFVPLINYLCLNGWVFPAQPPTLP